MSESGQEPWLRRGRVVWAGALLATLAVGGAVWLGLHRRPARAAEAVGEEAGPYVREFAIFGSYARLTFWAPTEVAAAAADDMAAELRRLHDTINVFDEQSELARLNRQAAREPVVCGPRLWAILQAAREAYATTHGAFDVSVGPLMALWGFHRKRDSAPTEDEIRAALATVGLDKVRFDESAQSVFFPCPGMSLDLGGIAKGYALDLMKARVAAHGLRAGLIDLGGNVLCLPEPPPGRDAYVLGVRHPQDGERLWTRVRVTGCAVATSGCYERFLDYGGRRYTHIIDPRTGWPVPDVASVTIVTPAGTDSDVFSTAVFVGGVALARELADARPGTSVLIIGLDAARQPVPIGANWHWPTAEP